MNIVKRMPVKILDMLGHHGMNNKSKRQVAAIFMPNAVSESTVSNTELSEFLALTEF